MQAMKYLAAIAAFAIASSLGAFAKTSNSGSFDLTDTASIGSTVLQPGHYKAEWTGSDTALQISIVKSGKTVATAEGHLKELTSKAPYTSVSTRGSRDNSRRVYEIDFDNRSEALVISGS
jgi:hypothetical protein